jgi:hypothetical protein
MSKTSVGRTTFLGFGRSLADSQNLDAESAFIGKHGRGPKDDVVPGEFIREF